MASLAELIVVIITCSTTGLGRPGLLWLGLSLLLVATGSLYLSVRVGVGGIRALWALMLELVSEAEDPDEAAQRDSSLSYASYGFLLEEASEDDDLTPSEEPAQGGGPSVNSTEYLYGPVFAASAIASSVYLLVSLSLTLLLASARAEPLIDMLLMLPLADVFAEMGLKGGLDLLILDPVFYLPLAVSFSALGLIGLGLFSLRAQPLLETSSMLWGISTGYTAAALAAHWTGVQLRPGILTPSVGFAYVLCAYCLMAPVAEHLPKRGMRAKYDYLAAGVGATVTASILSKVYGDVSAVFGGAVFFVTSFLGAALWENTVGRMLSQVPRALIERKLSTAWEEFRSLVRRGPCEENSRAARRELLIHAVIGLTFPVLAYLLVALVVRLL